MSPEVKLKAACVSGAGGNVNTAYEDYKLRCVSFAVDMPAGWYAMLGAGTMKREG